MPNILPCCYEVVQCKHYSRIVFLLHFSNFVMHFDVVWKHFISNRDFWFRYIWENHYLYRLRVTRVISFIIIILYWRCILTTEVYGITCYIDFVLFFCHSIAATPPPCFFTCALAACRLWSVSRGRTIWGNLTREFRLLQTKNGKSISLFNLATSFRFALNLQT